LAKAEIGIIGGSGLYNMDGLTEVHEERVETPFGEPSEVFLLGKLEGRDVAFLARHGKGHRILPSELNFKANIYAMKKLGVTSILSVSAVGSLKEEHKPTDFVIPDQFIDRTFDRKTTFFGNGVVGHVAFGDPVCAVVSEVFAKACEEVGVVGKRGGIYVCMEGPQFSTKAESRLYRSWGADVRPTCRRPSLHARRRSATRRSPW
jgi:5'-methylthioadenosine phosphorylase